MAQPYGRPLTLRQRMIVATYADGWQAKQVAAAFGLTRETVVSTVKDVRLKYEIAGRFAGTKIALGERLREDGYPL
jgi:DNA-binding CsgD family transcriptional regulator